MNAFELSASLALDSSNFDNGLKESESSASSFGSSLQTGLGNAAKVAGAALAATTAAVVGVGKALVDAVNDTAAYGDEIDKNSQKLGVSAQFYQEWDAVLQHSGTSMDSMTSTFKTLANAAQGATNDQAAAFEALGMSLDEVASMSSEDLFSTVISKLQGMEEGTERAAIANDLLGRGAMEMGALLNTSSEDTQAMIDTVNELGGVMSDTAVKDAAKFTDSLQDMQTSFTGLKRNLVSSFLPGFSKVMSGITKLFSGKDGAAEEVKSGVNEIASNFKDMIPKLVSTVSDIANAILPEIPGMLTTIISAITDSFPSLISGIMAVIPALVQAIIDALPSLLGAIETIFFAIVDALPGLMETIFSALPTLIPQLINTVINMVVYLCEHFSEIIQPIIDYLPDIILSIVNALMDNLPALIQGIISLVIGIVKAIPQIISGLLDAIPQIIVKVVSAIISCIPMLLAGIGQVVVEIVKALWSILKSVGKLISDVAAIVWSGIKTAFSSVAKWFYDHVIAPVGNFFTGMWNGLKNGAVQAWNGIKNAFASVGNFFKDTFSKAWQKVKDVFSTGGKIFSGLKDGIVSAFKTVVNAIIRGINKVIAVPFNAIKGMLDKIKNVSIVGFKPFSWINTSSMNAPQIPELAHGGVLKKGQVGYLEGDGDEAVVPLSKNTEWIDRVAEQIDIKGSNNDEILTKLDELIYAISSMGIVLDTGILVGETAPLMDRALGNLSIKNARYV